MLLLAVGDARIHADVEAAQQRTKGLVRAVAGEHLNRLPALMFLRTLVGNASDMLLQPATTTLEDIEKPHDGSQLGRTEGPCNEMSPAELACTLGE